METPDFFDRVPAIALHDPLAEFLGATRDGLIEVRYVDAVRLAGHSCPTVASTFALARAALRALYGDLHPQRGGIRVDMRGARTEGVTGVVGNVLSLITGATTDTGFKGLGGRFDRRGLLHYGSPIGGEFRLTRVDSGAAADCSARLERIPADPEMRALLGQCLDGSAGDAQRERFRELWQARVRALLIDHLDDSEVFRVEALASR
jgi:hypothetical protein